MFQKVRKDIADFILFHSFPDRLSLGAASVISRLDRKKIEEFQFKHLCQTIRHAYEHVPYWKNLFDSLNIRPNHIKSLDEFYHLPILRKDTFKERVNEFYASGWENSSYLSTTSSGTTGVPIKVVFDLDCGRRSRLMFMFWLSHYGLKDFRRVAHTFLGRPHLVVLGVPVDIYSFQDDYANFYKLLKDYQVQAISGMLSGVVGLARDMERRKITVALKFIQTAGENLTPSLRKYLEDIFNCPIYNKYGCAEVGNVGDECVVRDGFHVNAVTNFIEIVDDNGFPSSDNLPGRIIVTSLDNKIMPLIRYELSDTGQWLTSECRCGLTTPRIVLNGRDLYFFELPNNEKRSVMSVIHSLQYYYNEYIRQFQIIQESLSQIRVKIVPTPLYSSQMDVFVTRVILNALDYKEAISVLIDKVNDIPKLPNGKIQTFISKLDHTG